MHYFRGLLIRNRINENKTSLTPQKLLSLISQSQKTDTIFHELIIVLRYHFFLAMFYPFEL